MCYLKKWCCFQNFFTLSTHCHLTQTNAYHGWRYRCRVGAWLGNCINSDIKILFVGTNCWGTPKSGNTWMASTTSVTALTSPSAASTRTSRLTCILSSLLSQTTERLTFLDSPSSPTSPPALPPGKAVEERRETHIGRDVHNVMLPRNLTVAKKKSIWGGNKSLKVNCWLCVIKSVCLCVRACLMCCCMSSRSF